MGLITNLKSFSWILMADKLHIISDTQGILVKILCTFLFLSNPHICLRKIKNWSMNFNLITIQLLAMFLNAIRDYWSMRLILKRIFSKEIKKSSRISQKCFSFRWTVTTYEDNITEIWIQKVETVKDLESSQYCRHQQTYTFYSRQ